MIVFFEGFETYGLAEDRAAIDDVYNFPVGIVSNMTFEIVSSSRSISTQALRAYNPELVGVPVYMLIPLASLGSEDTWAIGIAIKDDNWSNLPSPWPILQFRDVNAAALLTLVSTSTGLSLRRGDYTTTEIDSYATTLQESWTYFEFKATFHASTGSYDIQVNGSSVMSDTGVNTTATGNVRPYEIAIGMPIKAQGRDIDDIYVLDDQPGATGNEATDLLGPVQAMRNKPNGVGDSSGFTTSAVAANWTLVDEDGEDADTTYVQARTAGDKDLYHFENATGLIDTIFGVSARPVLRKSDGGSRTYRLLAKSDGVEDQTGTRYPSNTYVRQSCVWETDPATSTQWTLQGFNDAQFGIEVVA